jgi:hypothetical protein
VGADFPNAIALSVGEWSLPFIGEIGDNATLSGHNLVRLNRILTYFKSTLNVIFPFLVYNGVVAQGAL